MNGTLENGRVLTRSTVYDVAGIMGGLYGPGIIGLKGAFTREWVKSLKGDIERAYAEALR
jgi:hypothetical protein